VFALKSPLRRTQNEKHQQEHNPQTASWPRETLRRGLAGHSPVALHLKQGPRLSNKWGPPHIGKLRTGTRSAQTREKRHRSGCGAFRETRSGRPGRSSRGLRVAHQSEDRCGSAIDRAILQHRDGTLALAIDRVSQSRSICRPHGALGRRNSDSRHDGKNELINFPLGVRINTK
jgi:hypothetical protein